ncbi:uncharacterized protein LOC1274394 [Anopheles gambiae]|uniref:uncharacterized protein LOC1274394 n=1 Tax=Anopheles gambiae TaxID=7165 RepID=UPI002AC8A3AD|nr:uncharacterized protein LOC1274394 [Anopheles gambiae]XP_313514.6 uncharacterized protein LOC1274394 [Anopheles gambiae]
MATNHRQMRAIKRNALSDTTQRSDMTSTKTTATLKCNSRMCLWFMLWYLCFALSSAQELSLVSHSTDENQLKTVEPSTEISADLPRPIVTLPIDANQTNHDTLEITPRRHKTRRKGTGSSGSSSSSHRNKPKKRKNAMQLALQSAARKGLEAMIELYDRAEPNLLKRGAVLDANDPGALLAQFSASNQTEMDAKAAYATLIAAKTFKESTNVEYVALGRQAPPKISLKKTPLEKLCPSREAPRCVPASLRYRTHDGTCNNARRPRWGSAQMPFHRFLAPEYQDGVEGIRRSVTGATLPSARFVSLVVHGSRNEEAPVTMMLALWGQLIDHDITATSQPRSINGSTPRCCNGGEESTHPSCLPIKVPQDDPWLSHLGVRCLEFLRSAPAQRRDCLLSWREQTNQATSFLDASPIYSSNPRSSDNARIFRNGMLLFGRGPPHEDVCFRAALANQCIRPGDSRSGEQPGLLMMHMIWVNEHNQIATRLADINPHWSDEKVYQETRRIVGALFQHITYREFLPLVLGKEVCRLFDLELETSGYYRNYDANVNPTVANEFSAAAFRFGHSLIQSTYMRADRHHRFIANNVSLHEDTSEGDFGGPGSLHRLLRGMVNQRALKRDEFITAELTNHLFQTKSFPFGLDLAAINIQRGRDHGLPAYVNWRGPCGLSTIKDWSDLERVMGPASTNRLRKAYRTIDDIDLFVGGLAERPVVGGIVGPTFSCIIAQQFSNLRKGDRFWYENPGFESSFTPAQLESIRQIGFAQVLCRALGGGGTLQPFVFLPADFGQNERLSCESRLMAPIDLTPWKERDPFNNDTGDEDEDEDEDDEDDDEATVANGTASTTDLETAQSSTFSSTTTTTRRPTLVAETSSNVINKVDLITNGNTGVQPNRQRPQSSTLTVGPTVIISNKVDFTPSTSTRPKPTAQSSTATAIDNKLDLKVTTKPTPKRKPTRKPTTKKRPTTSSATKPLVTSNLDFSRNANGTVISDTDSTERLARTKRATTKVREQEARYGYYQTPAPPTDYSDYDEDYNTDYDLPPPYLAYGYHRPTTKTTTTTTTTQPPPPPYGYYPPYGGGYYTAPPTPPPPPPPPNPYFDTRRPLRTTTPRRRLSDKLTLNVDAPQHNAPQRPRTSTFRPPTDNNPHKTPSNKPFKPSSLAQTSVFSVDFKSLPTAGRSLSTNSSAALNDTVLFATAINTTLSKDDSTVLSRTAATRSGVSTSGDLPMKLSESFSIYDYDNDYDDAVPNPTRHTSTSTNDNDSDRLTILPFDEHDGYLRPEQTHFEPLVRPSVVSTGQTYRNYYGTNETTQTIHYADYTNGRTSGPLYRDATENYHRYAPAHHEQLLLDDYSDKYVGLFLNGEKRDKDNGSILTRTKHNRPRMIDGDDWTGKDSQPDQRAIRDDTGKDRRTSVTKQKHKRPTNHRLKTSTKKPSAISLVPFVLLTSIDRPDNWVMYHSKPSKHRKPPAAVPLLKSDTFSLSEFPTPIADPD